MIQMLELAKKYFKVAMITMLKEIKEKEKENMFEMTEKIWNLSREIHAILKKWTNSKSGLKTILSIKWDLFSRKRKV